MLLVTLSLTLMAGNLELPPLGHLVEAVDARGGLLGDALDGVELLLVPAGLGGVARLDGGEEHVLLLAGGVVQHGSVVLGLGAQVDEQGGVAAVIQDHVGRALGELEDAVREVPVLLQALPLVGEDGDAPAAMAAAAWSWVEKMLQLAQRTSAPRAVQGLDEHGRLDGHVQGAGDARALQGLAAANSLRMAMRAGISPSAIRSSLRPQSAREMSATW